MTEASERSYATYHLGRLMHLRIEDGLLPDFQGKLGFCQAEGAEPQLTIRRGNPRPALDFNPISNFTFVSDGFQAVVVSWRSKIGEELLVSDGAYEIVGEGGVYEISPGNVTIHGRPSDGFMDLIIRPLANQVLVPQGAVMAHAGAVRIDGKVVLLLGESGKTSLVLSLLAKGADYLADECAFLDAGGMCRPYTPIISLNDRHFEQHPELVEACYPDATERRRVRTSMSFYRMGASLSGRNMASRQARAMLTTRSRFNGLSCRFDAPFPKAKMVDSGRITHVFHLRSTNEEGPLVPMDHRRIADIESTSAWVRTGHLFAMAKLAGMPTIDLPMMQEAFANAIKGADCYQARMRLREGRTREDTERAAEEIVRLVAK